MNKKKLLKILVVDDEPSIREVLEYNLKKTGYKVQTAKDGKEAISTAHHFLPDLILLDIMMPKMDGVETCRHLKAIPHFNPYIVILTARSEEYSEVASFDVGADDYLLKPIKPRALISRIQAIFRRKNQHQEKEKKEKITVHKLVIDRSSYSVKVKNKKVELPKKEFELLYFLASNPNKIFSRDDLLHNIWGTDVYVIARTVDVHIRKVREKIGKEYISTVKGVGYKFNFS